MRKCEIYKNKKWVEIDFKNLKKGDMFRLIDDGELYKDDNTGRTQWTAKSNAYYDIKLNSYMIDTYEE